MPNREIHNSLIGEVALNTQGILSNTTTNGNWIDLQGFDAVEFYFVTGSVADGDYLPLIMDSESSAGSHSDAAAVADTFLTNTEANTGFTSDDDDNSIKRIGYRGNKRYVRFSVVSTNTSLGATLGAVAVKGYPAVGPVAANS